MHNPPMPAMPNLDAALAFIARWQGVTASELSTAQSFVRELCDLLAVPVPHPTAEQDYMFERPVTFRHGDGSESPGRIDCYKRGHFVLEAKKLKPGADPTVRTKGFDDAMLRARAQAEGYARALPAAEGRPPLLMVVDVGHVIELYAEFSRSGATYTPFPDPASHRIRLADLVRPEILARLHAAWTAPDTLDPSKIAARVTRQIAGQLAGLAKSLEAAGHPPQSVAAFLTRCLFSMFAEDVGLLPLVEGEKPFARLLAHYAAQPETLARMMTALWQDMDRGGFSAVLAGNVLRFNGKLFKDASAIVLSREQIALLDAAADADWQEVEPAIFGTLLERALDPAERHALGAHYTPRAYVERLVLPTVIDPLREQWHTAQASALVLAGEATALAPRDYERKMAEARAVLHDFHHALCQLRVLDPACGSGNFLYVTLEHMKRLEGEVLNLLAEFGDTQGRLDAEGLTVDPHQFLGIELNPRAAAVAELVLWIGYLQWHFRTRGQTLPPQPVLKDFANIECRDAVLAWDAQEPALDAHGKPLTRWDGKTKKRHPVTGEAVPDETAVVMVWRYQNPRKAVWPQADYIVGNPPFIGAGPMRAALGDGYVETLRKTWPDVPESADFVMYWWQHAASLVLAGKEGQDQPVRPTRRFGLITTNSLRQTFNRRVTQAALDAGLALQFAVPDHPWVDAADGAAVRIAMTVGALPGTHGTATGLLATVTSESPPQGEDDALAITLAERTGRINADLSIGADVASVGALRGNGGLAFRGVTLMGSGFWLEPEDPLIFAEPEAIKPLLNGRDLTDRSRGVFCIDFYGLSEDQARRRFPSAFQRVLDGVKPERDQSQRASYRAKWWIFAEARPELRRAIRNLDRYIATSMTAKHRAFQWIDGSTLPDQGLVAIATNDPLHLGLLSSEGHVIWALATGGRLGVGNDPRYNQSRCFETFPFPAEDTGMTSELAEQIRSLAEELDAHRKRQQAAHPGLTLTGMYNVLEALRAGRALTAKEKTIHEQGLVSVLKTLHDALDAAVLAAYGWADLSLPAQRDTLLERLVALNQRRAAEEATGTIRWLRPAFQNPPKPAEPAPAPQQIDFADETANNGAGFEPELAENPHGIRGMPSDTAAPLPPPLGGGGPGRGSQQLRPTARAAALPWPDTLPAQVAAVAALIAASPTPLPLPALQAAFKGKSQWKNRLDQVLETLEALGKIRGSDEGWRGV